MPGLLQMYANKNRELAEGDPEAYVAQTETVATPEAQVASETKTPGPNFSLTPKSKAVVRWDENDDEYARLWSPYGKMWIPVKTYRDEGSGTTYWYDASDRQFYPIMEE